MSKFNEHLRDGPRLSFQTLQVLAIMLENPDSDHYGLEVAKAAGLPSGTLYPILARLERHEWLESDWENINPKVAGRRPRRYYRFTEKGRREARGAAKQIKEIFSGQAGLAV